MDLLDTLAAYMDMRETDKIRNRAFVATSTYLLASPAQAEQHLADFFRHRIGRGNYNDCIIAFCVAAMMFTTATTVVTELFLSDGFLSTLGPLMRRKWKSRKVETACLEMLNAACSVTACREAIDKYCSDWLEEIVDSDPAEAIIEISRETDVQMQGTASLRRHSEHVLNVAAVVLTKVKVRSA